MRCLITAFLLTNKNAVVIHIHRRTGRCGVLAIATWAAWFWAAKGRLLTKKKDERKREKMEKEERKKERRRRKKKEKKRREEREEDLRPI